MPNEGRLRHERRVMRALFAHPDSRKTVVNMMNNDKLDRKDKRLLIVALSSALKKALDNGEIKNENNKLIMV